MKLNTAQTDHLGQQQLLSVLSGDADPGLNEYARDHIEACPDCREQLETLAAKPDLWNHVTTLMDNDRLGDTVALTSDLASDEQSRLSDNSQPWLDDHQMDGLSIESLLDQPSHPEMLGRLGNYDIEREIGRGGMGVVLKAFDTELNRPVAIKIMSPVLAGRGAARQRFAREARAAAAILHPNVIAIHGISAADRTPYLVMPYITGPSLEQIVEQNGPLPERDIVRYAMQIAAGLAAAHSQGVIHRDIKPANILIENGVGRVVITDFGLARAESDVSMTQTGWFAGTPAFMSPEQASGRDVDSRGDLFSLGSVMYYMATGRLPFRADQPMAILERIRTEHPKPARQVNSDISPTLSNLIGRLLVKKPADRIQTAAELQQTLEQYLAHLHQPAHVKRPKISTPRRTGSSDVLRPLTWSLAGALALGACIWGWSLLTTPDDNQRRVESGPPLAPPLQPESETIATSGSMVPSAVNSLKQLEQDIVTKHKLVEQQFNMLPEKNLQQDVYTVSQRTDEAFRFLYTGPRHHTWGFSELDAQIREIDSAVQKLQQMESRFGK